MQKPANYLELSPIELHRWARKLLVWNCNQTVSDKIHNEHYRQEIKPLHDRIDEIWVDFWRKNAPQPCGYCGCTEPLIETCQGTYLSCPHCGGV